MICSSPVTKDISDEILTCSNLKARNNIQPLIVSSVDKLLQ